MFESEVNHRREHQRSIPEAILADLRSYRRRVTARSVLPWGEHCTECAWPTCYTSCELYDARADGNCRQFDEGVIRVPTPGASNPYLQKITFRRWAKLWAPGTLVCRPLGEADWLEALNMAVGSAARAVPVNRALKQRILAKVGYVRRRRLSRPAATGEQRPDCFALEVYNPGARAASMTLSIWAGAPSPAATFQRLLEVQPGFTRVRIALEEIVAIADTSGEFQVELVPNDAEHLTLYFGLMDFVREHRAVPADMAPPMEARPARSEGAANGTGPGRNCKCVVWDLDNTLWSGTLIEDGVDRLTVSARTRALVEELDRRGILQSVASKNHAEDALAALHQAGLKEYFLYPQIGWMPKSQSIAKIAASLNIDAGTFVFIDDQAFERAEVAAAHPTVTVLDATQIDNLLDSPRFDVPVTAESGRRRAMYREQEQRDALEASYRGNYLGFLRDNRMEARLRPLEDSNAVRVYELAQRTNQMNFSGNRYAKDQLERIRTDPALDTFVIRCEDRFGSYGIVGFALVDNREPRLLDLMFSCRVQAKRVEHAILAWLVARYRTRGGGDFFANFRKTPKNEPSGAVFGELGFEEVEIHDGVASMRFARSREVPVESIVNVVEDMPS